MEDDLNKELCRLLQSFGDFCRTQDLSKAETDSIHPTQGKVKQAFIDAGWQSPGGGLRGNSMTGQEWYDRFEKELEKIGAKDNVRSISGAIAKNAAKKAAGIE